MPSVRAAYGQSVHFSMVKCRSSTSRRSYRLCVRRLRNSLLALMKLEMTQSYSDIILQGSMDIIVDAAEKMNPIVRESDFKARVLPLIQRPFHHANLSAYAKYLAEISRDIPFDLTYPLHVVSDE